MCIYDLPPHTHTHTHSVTNLKCWTSSSVITNKTLQLLNDLSVGYSSVRKLVKLNTIQFILENHTVHTHTHACIITIAYR